jgi:FKBP-type peptidyl-prolyl cis-trans isomerase
MRAIVVVAAISAVACQPRKAAPPPTETTKPVAAIAVVPPDAIRGPRGLASKVLAAGDDSKHPDLHDRIVVRYTGWTAAGRAFASANEAPATFPMLELIPGWIEALSSMARGEKRRIWVPAALAYGDSSADPAKPSGDLVFDIELLGILPGSDAPLVPPDLSPVPSDAKRTRSGLAYRILEHGTGARRPQAESTVEVRYTGWRTDGHVYNSTADRSGPALLALASTQPGWRESVRLMVVGDKGRFWIPDRLLGAGPAVSGRAGDGMLVFDIELLAIR